MPICRTCSFINRCSAQIYSLTCRTDPLNRSASTSYLSPPTHYESHRLSARWPSGNSRRPHPAFRIPSPRDGGDGGDGRQLLTLSLPLSLSLSLSPEETLILLMGESKDGQPLGRRAADAAASSLLAAHMQQCRARTPTWSDHFLASCLLRGLRIP